MSGIHLEQAGALGALADLIADGEEHRRRLIGAGPSLPTTALGAGFTDRAQAVADLLRRVHESRVTRVDALLATAGAAVAEVRRYGDVEKQNAADFGGMA